MKLHPATAALTDALDARVTAVLLDAVEAEAGQPTQDGRRVRPGHAAAIGWLHRPYDLLPVRAPGQMSLLGART